SADTDEPDTRQLRNLLDKDRVRQVFDFRKRERVRRQGQRQHRGVSRIDFVVDGRDRQIGRKIIVCGVDRGLYALLSDIDIQVQIELQRDQRTAERTG